MADARIRLQLRLSEFWRNLKQIDFKSAPVVVHGIGWFISFAFLAALVDASDHIIIILLFIHAYFLFKGVRAICTKAMPPVELLLLGFWTLFVLEILLLQTANILPSTFDPEPATPAVFLLGMQIILLAPLTLFFSLILAYNAKGKISVIIWYFILGIVASNFMGEGWELYLFIYQILLFILLLRRTNWLEALTKTECWLYLIFFFIIFTQVINPNPFETVNQKVSQQEFLWAIDPYYLYMLFKLYILAILVKIPVVLVYNHARLSRKLWISGLFQSTFPQIIQFIMLFLVFHFFIAGWQAENVRQALVNQIDEMRSPGGLESLDYLEHHKFAIGEYGEINGFHPVSFSKRTPEEGIVSIERRSRGRFQDESEKGHFLFFRPENAEEDSVYLVELSPQLLGLVSRSTHVLAGTALQSYAYNPSTWESFFYTPSFLSEDRGIRLFPYAISPKEEEQSVFARIESRYVITSVDSDLELNLFGRDFLTMGRILMPLYDTRWREDGYYVFDVLLEPDTSFLLSPIMRNIYILFGLYLLINLLIIRRVVKFGSEINRMIVQKFNQLKSGIVHISSGNLDYKVKLEGQDEFVELGDRFNRMGDKLKETIAEAREKDRLEHELSIARQVQHSLIPPSLPDVQGFQVAATFQTATEVGGDFYDITPLGNNKFLFTIGDVSGKSTSAAFYMAQCISLIRFSPQFTEDPREIALRLNDYFVDPLVDRQMFVTAIVGLLDANENTIRYVRAGHTFPIFIPGNRNEEIRELELSGLGIGLVRGGEMLEKMLQSGDVPMAPGDTLVLYTDGVVEATRAGQNGSTGDTSKMEFFGEERLLNLIRTSRDKSALDMQQSILNELEGFYGGKPPTDDYTLLIIQKE
ncbi:MAG: PP2C family protein-serine/threonine phosphatase [bacterium]